MVDYAGRQPIIFRAPSSTLDAKAQADLAAAFAAQAALSAQAAAAAAEGRIYPDYATGNAATTTGQYFYVASGGNLALYVHGTGSPIVMLPSVNAATGALTVTKSNHGDVASFVSAGSGGETLFVYADDSIIGLFNVTGAGAGRDGFQIADGEVSVDINAEKRVRIGSMGFQYTGTAIASRSLYAYADDSVVGIFDVSNAGAGRNGMRIGTNFVAFDVNAVERLRFDSNGYVVITETLDDYADDTAAASGGVPVKGLYRTASAVKVRVA